MTSIRPNIILNEFTLVCSIGDGATAEVWKATDQTGQAWALKIFKTGQFDQAAIRTEFGITRRLQHEHLLLPLKMEETADGTTYFASR